MADTFFEKWLEEQRKELPGDKSEKYKKIKAALDAKEQPAIEKRKQQAKNKLEKRITKKADKQGLGKGQEFSKDNPAPNTQPVEKPNKSVTKRHSQTDRALDIKQQEADRKDRAQAAKEKQYTDKSAD